MPLHSLLFVITFFACLLINSGHANYLAHSNDFAYIDYFEYSLDRDNISVINSKINSVELFRRRSHTKSGA